MNAAGLKALYDALANVEDNLYRYRNFLADGTTTGFGWTKEEAVAALEAQRDELLAAIKDAAAPTKGSHHAPQ